MVHFGVYVASAVVWICHQTCPVLVLVKQLVYGGVDGISSQEAIDGLCLSVSKLVLDDHVPVIRGDTPTYHRLFARLLGLVGGLRWGLVGGL
jgi:hypothetical protein